MALCWNVLAAATGGLLICCSAAVPEAGAPPETTLRTGTVDDPPPPPPASPLPSGFNLPTDTGGPSGPTPTTAPTPLAGRVIWATAGNKLLKFTSDAPSKVEVRDVAGLAPGEQLVGLDFRKNGTLYAVGTTSSLFSLATGTATATAVSTAPFAALLDGTGFGFDFDPVSDLARVTSNTSENIRVEAGTGTVTNVDGPVRYMAGDPHAGALPRAAAVAYAADGACFAIDAQTGTLARFVDSYSGQIRSIGALGQTVTDIAGFDIAGNDAFAALRVGTTTSLYAVDLATGKVTSLGKIGDGGPLSGLTIQPN